MVDGMAMPRSGLGIIGLVTFVGSAFVGFNTLVTSCASENLTRNAAQLHAVEENERFWTEAMQELADIVKDKNQTASNYEARCKLLARRTAPFSSAAAALATGADGNQPPAELAALSERVGKLQAEFATQIRDPAIVGPQCSSEFDRRKQVDQQKNDASNRVATELAKTDRTGDELPYDAIAARTDLITLSAPSAKGIDVDLYWCDSADDASATANFRAALLLGRRLAGYAESGSKLTFGQQSDPVGQVRVRILSRTLLTPGSDYARALGYNVLRGRTKMQPFMRAFAADARESGIRGLDRWTYAGPGANEPNWYVAAAICSASAAAALPAAGGTVDAN